MANLNDLPAEMMELGVEKKKNGKNWNNLPDEMKEMVVKEMTIETRTRLKMCSKADKQLVESIRMPFDKLNIKLCWDVLSVKLHSEKLQKPVLDLEIWTNYGTVKIKDLNKEECVERGAKIPNNEKHVKCSSIKKTKNLVRQMFASIVSSFRCDSVNAKIDAPDFDTNLEFTIKTNHINIRGSPSQVTGLLKNVAPGVKSVYLNTYRNEGLEDIGSISAVINAKKLVVFCSNDINDEQLLKLNCTSLNLDFESNITAKGINQLIKKAIANDYPKGSKLVTYVDKNVMFQTWKDIIEGLDVEVTESEDVTLNDGQVKFEKRRGRIHMNHGKWMNLYQLDNGGLGLLKIEIHQ